MRRAFVPVLVVALLVSVLAGNFILVFAVTPGVDLPAVSIIHPEDGDFFGSNTVYLEFDVDPPTFYPELYITSVYYRLDEGDLNFVYLNVNLSSTPLLRELHDSLNLTGISDGVHTIRVLADYTGVHAGLFIEGSSPWDPITSFTVDAFPPEVKILSPEQGVYNVSSVPLVFTVSKPVSGMVYCLDGGQNLTLTDNATLAGLQGGRHSLVIYATDKAGHMGASEARLFEVNTPNPFPTTLVAVAIIGSAAVVSFGLVAYLLRRKKRRSTS